jgi:hypothetical protein
MKPTLKVVAEYVTPSGQVNLLSILPWLAAKKTGQPRALRRCPVGAESDDTDLRHMPTVSSVSRNQRKAGCLFQTLTMVLGIRIGLAIAVGIEDRRDSVARLHNDRDADPDSDPDRTKSKFASRFTSIVTVFAGLNS